jgi:GTPase SAR1 family protein
MGNCVQTGDNLTPEERTARKVEKDKSRNLDAQMNRDQHSDTTISKLLLLGAGESGKSTLFKQMITIYGKGFSDDDKKGYTSIIYNNIITSMKTLCIQADVFSAALGGPAAAAKAVFDDLKMDEEINDELGEHIEALWADDGIQEVYGKRAGYQLTDSASYFFERLEEVKKSGYLPSQQDVLRSRVRTTGIVENEFIIDGNQFKMFDVGGQRNERKKWIHCFEKVTAVLFVAAISEYDQVLYEDENTNRMVEALNLFEEICNSRWFRKTSMILFLNKRDLFADKITKVPLTVCFPEYDGGADFDAGQEFLKFQFESKNRNADKQIYTHVTCATDTTNVAAVFNAVKDIIIRKSLNEAGLV